MDPKTSESESWGSIETIDVPQKDLRGPLHKEHLRQAKWAFNIAAAFGIVGVTLLLSGFGLLIFGGDIKRSTVTLVSGLGSGGLFAWALKFHRETLGRLVEIRRDTDALTAGLSIQDNLQRDAAVLEVVKAISKRKT